MSDCAFGICDGSGFVFDDATNTAYDCRCRPQLVAQAKARSLSAVIPRRYRDVSFERAPVTEIEPRAVVAETRRFVDHVDENLDSGRGLWFVGATGTGKTTLAMLVSKAALKAGRSVAIYSLPRLLNEIRDYAHRAERSHLDLLDRLTTIDLLHVDDVGAERTTDWVLEELYSIVNARYEDQRSMVITTNLGYDELAAQISERTVSRLTEMCVQLPLQGEDRRIESEAAAGLGRSFA
jgi:DNA replication protein DnaC